MLALSLFTDNQFTCEFDENVVSFFCQQVTVDKQVDTQDVLLLPSAVLT